MAEYALLVSFFKGFSISAHGVKIGIIVPCDASAGLEEHFGIGNIPPLLQHPHLPFPRVDLQVAAVPFDRSIQRVLLRPVKTDPGKNSFGVAAAHGKAALIQFPAVIGKIPDHGLNPLPPILSCLQPVEKPFFGHRGTDSIRRIGESPQSLFPRSRTSLRFVCSRNQRIACKTAFSAV